MDWPRAAIQAFEDARRAWAVVPSVYRVQSYGLTKTGGWGVGHRRRFKWREVLRMKAKVAIRTFMASIMVGLAREVVINRYPEEGLLANFLHVLEVVHRVRPGARVRVEWNITGSEIGFRYGEKGDDVWPKLFRLLRVPPTGRAHLASRRLDFAFWGTGKDHLSGRQLQMHRDAYHSTFLNSLEITSPRVRREVNDICAERFHGRFCIGIHRRVGNAMVANLQAKGNIPTPLSIIQTVASLISKLTHAGVPDYVVFLATDDADAVGPFQDAFGSNLIVRENVRRTTADQAEVHFGEWADLSIRDAEDVLVDTWLLSQCSVLVHASSSVSTVAAIMNPQLVLIRA